MDYFDVNLVISESEYMLAEHIADNYRIRYNINKITNQIYIQSITIYKDISAIKIPPYIKYNNEIYPVNYIRGTLDGIGYRDQYKLTTLILDFDIKYTWWILGPIKQIFIKNISDYALYDKYTINVSRKTKIIYVKEKNTIIYRTSKLYDEIKYVIK